MKNTKFFGTGVFCAVLLLGTSLHADKKDDFISALDAVKLSLENSGAVVGTVYEDDDAQEVCGGGKLKQEFVDALSSIRSFCTDATEKIVALKDNLAKLNYCFAGGDSAMTLARTSLTQLSFGVRDSIKSARDAAYVFSKKEIFADDSLKNDEKRALDKAKFTDRCSGLLKSVKDEYKKKMLNVYKDLQTALKEFGNTWKIFTTGNEKGQFCL